MIRKLTLALGAAGALIATTAATAPAGGAPESTRGTAPASSTAKPTAEDIIKYRHSVMEAIGSHMNAAAMIVRGQVAYPELAVHADAIAASLEGAEQWFPAGTAEGETEALPAIWEKPDAFAKAMQRGQTASQEFKSAVTSGDRAAIGGAFRNLGGACKGCHDDFRKPQD